MDNISEVFDVAPLPGEKLPALSNDVSTVTDDSNFARNNLRQLIETSRSALEHALSVAVQSDSPRAYEVLANLINTAADLNTKLMDVHQKEQKIVGTKEGETSPTSVTNNSIVFTGTTAELSTLIMKKLNP